MCDIGYSVGSLYLNRFKILSGQRVVHWHGGVLPLPKSRDDELLGKNNTTRYGSLGSAPELGKSTPSIRPLHSPESTISDFIGLQVDTAMIVRYP